mmetsp:Transcript_25109/g.32208  ORF Transcript_25109/g.32208 Transcript_25109/m.32208 type:complete len:157 (+) Transcript_25109:1-471(+)
MRNRSTDAAVMGGYHDDNDSDDNSYGATPPVLALKGKGNALPEVTEVRMDIFAPAGKLGVVVDSPPEGGSAYVSDIKMDSPIYGKIRLGDKLIAVDGEDVSKLKAVHVSMLLGSKSRNANRQITVLREVDNDDKESTRSLTVSELSWPDRKQYINM